MTMTAGCLLFIPASTRAATYPLFLLALFDPRHRHFVKRLIQSADQPAGPAGPRTAGRLSRRRSIPSAPSSSKEDQQQELILGTLNDVSAEDFATRRAGRLSHCGIGDDREDLSRPRWRRSPWSQRGLQIPQPSQGEKHDSISSRHWVSTCWPGPASASAVHFPLCRRRHRFDRHQTRSTTYSAAPKA